MSQTFKTTEAHFRAFRAEGQRLVRLFGINDWRVDFSHERLNSNNRAECRSNLVNRVSSIVLSTEWGPKDGNGDKHYAPSIEGVQETARHEVIHLLLARVHNLGCTRYVTEDEMVQAIEGLCRHLHNLLPR